MNDDFFLLTNDQEEHARAVYEKSIVIDCSNVAKLDSMYFHRRISAGVTVENITVPRPGDYFAKSVDALLDHIDWIKRNSKAGTLILTRNDIILAKQNRKAGAIFGPQHSDFLQGKLSLLQVIYDLGVRIIQLTYNERNLIGDGCTERTNSGLSNFGVSVVKEMNRIGTVIDLSHCGPATFMDAVKHSDDPVMCTHANCKALNPNVRNKSDEQIHALAEKGGVICVASYSPVCETKTQVRPTIVDFLDHMEHIIDLVGIDHVGVGMDFDDTLTKESHEEWASAYPSIAAGIYFGMDSLFAAGLDSLELFPNIARGLVWRGYSDSEISKVLGGNVMRIFERVWGE
jgi:membrane dipeptidase